MESKVKHLITKFSFQVLLFSSAYLLQRALLFLVLKNDYYISVGPFYLHELVLLCTSFLFVRCLFEVSSPYKK